MDAPAAGDNTFANNLAKIEADFDAVLRKLVKRLDEHGTFSGHAEDRGAQQFREALAQLDKLQPTKGKAAPDADATGKKKTGDESGDRLGQVIAEHIARVLDRNVPRFGAARHTFDLARAGWMGRKVQRGARVARAAVMRSKVGRWARGGLSKMGGHLAGTKAGRSALGVTGRKLAGAAAMRAATSAAAGAAATGTGTAAAGGAAAGGAAAGGATAAAGAGGAATAAGGAAAGGAAAAVSATGVGLLAVALGAAVYATYKFGKAAENAGEILDRSMKRGQFSAATAHIQAEREARTAYREKDIGDRTAASAGYLMRSEQERAGARTDRDVLAEKVSNYVTAISVQLNQMLEWPVNAIARGVNKLVEGKDEKATPTMFEIGRAAADASRIEREDEEKRLQVLRLQIEGRRRNR